MDVITYAVAKKYTDTAIQNLPTAFKVKPAVASYANLPTTGNSAGDVRETLDTNIEWYWDGTAWKQYGQDNAVSYNEQTGKTAIEKAQARVNIGAQEVLPDATAGKYLHANSSTGALEWTDALPAYSAEDEGKVLKIVSGVPTWTTP